MYRSFFCHSFSLSLKRAGSDVSLPLDMTPLQGVVGVDGLGWYSWLVFVLFSFFLIITFRLFDQSNQSINQYIHTYTH